jgi:prepilin signal peptidase PulO-like enzyme (type II secretory pathway)
MATGLTMLFVLVMVVAMAWDAATLEIPDTASIVLATGFLGGAIVRDAGLSVVLQHTAAGLALFAVGAGLFRFGVWGGGDVKFMAATGLWFGWGGLPAWLFMGGAGGGRAGPRHPCPASRRRGTRPMVARLAEPSAPAGRGYSIRRSTGCRRFAGA